MSIAELTAEGMASISAIGALSGETIKDIMGDLAERKKILDSFMEGAVISVLFVDCSILFVENKPDDVVIKVIDHNGILQTLSRYYPFDD